MMDLSFTSSVGAVIGLILLALGGYVITVWRIHIKYSHIPGPPRTSFFLGNISAIKKAWTTTHNMNELFHQWNLKYGKTFVMFWASEPVVLTVDRSAIKQILCQNNFPKSKERYEPVSRLYGERFVGSGFAVQIDPVKWKKSRETADPLFHRQSLRDSLIVFNEVIDDLMIKFRGLAESGRICTMLDEMHNVTLDVIGKVAFNENIKALSDESSPFAGAIHTIMQGYTTALMDPFWRIKFWDRRAEKQMVQNSCKILRAAARSWLYTRLEMIQAGTTSPNDALTMFINAAEKDRNGNIVDEDAIIDDIVIIFVGGQETTANTAATVIMQVCRHPEILTRIRDEIEQVLGGRSVVTFEDLGKLSYIDAVVKETLRLYPIGPMIFRKAPTDITIDGYSVPKGTNICVSMYASARYPEFISSPLDFNPDRFLGPVETRPGQFENFPFSLGQRNCIGKNFAMMELKIIVARLFQRFNVILDSSQSYAMVENGTLRPQDGVRCLLTTRDKEIITQM